MLSVVSGQLCLTRKSCSLRSEFREVVSGRRRGPLAASLRGVLGLAEHPYGWIVARKNARFDRGSCAGRVRCLRR